MFSTLLALYFFQSSSYMQPNAPQGLVGVKELILNCCDFLSAWKDTGTAGSIPGHASSGSSRFSKGENCLKEAGYLVRKTVMESTLFLQWELKIKILLNLLSAFEKFEYMQNRTHIILQLVLSLVFAWHWFKSWFNQRSERSNQRFQSGWLEA